MKGSAPLEAAGLYVHIPFCSAICPYCDFAVVTGGRSSRARYVRNLRAEIELYADWPLRFDSVYFGGGTPSLLEPDDLGELLRALRKTLRVTEDAWVFLEANPEDVDASSLDDWRNLGVKTLSLGIQSFDRQELRFLGRRHDREQAKRSVDMAREAGFHTVSIDLIYGLPGQQPDAWKRNLSQAIQLGPEHVSCYELTVHEGTPFARHKARGKLVELSDGGRAELFEMTHTVLGDAGYEAYEVSNFARKPEYRSRHNQKYWTHAPYLGLGLAAHSYRGRTRWWNERGLCEYESRLAAGERPVAGSETLGAYELALEGVMLGLRTRSGIDLADFRSRYSLDLVDRNAERLGRYVQEGIATLDHERLQLTRRGLAVADSIARALDIG